MPGRHAPFDIPHGREPEHLPTKDDIAVPPPIAHNDTLEVAAGSARLAV